jgi:hypothetical protein
LSAYRLGPEFDEDRGDMSRPKSQKPAPDYGQYELRRECYRGAPRGAAVAYSTDTPEQYAPLAGAQCFSMTGYPRRNHDYDGDGVCLWCNLETA